MSLSYQIAEKVEAPRISAEHSSQITLAADSSIEELFDQLFCGL